MVKKTDSATQQSKTEKPADKLINRSADGVFRMREGLKYHFKLLYIAMVFTGAALVWYGIWQGVQSIPVVNNPVVAIALGLVLLGLTGRVNKLE